MPEYWYQTRPNRLSEDDDEETSELKSFNMNICASRKPLFMIYVYPDLKQEYNEFMKKYDYCAQLRFWDTEITSVDEIIGYQEKTETMEKFLEEYDRELPVGTAPCTINRITKIFDEFVSANL